ncbi:MAG: hypothetical protein Q7R54_01520 [bacterium]|nr:hypothetical protein [bacterium]
MHTIQDATRVAQILLSIPVINGIELFGSVARDGEGKDIDLILVVSEEGCGHFVAAARDLARLVAGLKAAGDTSLLFLEESSICFTGLPPSLRDVEYEKGEDGFTAPSRLEYLLTETFGPMAEEALTKLQEEELDSVDVLCFPTDWREKIDKVQRLLPHRDPGFVFSLVRDAIPFDKEKAAFTRL